MSSLLVALVALGVGVGATGVGGPVTATGAPHGPIGPGVASMPTSGLMAAVRAVSGPASWYCKPGRSACTRGYRGGLHAAAGPKVRAMLGSRYRGQAVTVWAGIRRVRVTIVDWCACPGGRVLDLYADAFDNLAPLSRGTVAVRVTR